MAVPGNGRAKKVARDLQDALDAPTTSKARADVVNGKSLVGASSKIGKAGIFIPTATLSGWFVAGSGVVMSTGVVTSEA